MPGMEPMGPETERHLRSLEAAYERERQQRDLLAKKYARLKRRYIRLERTHAKTLQELRGTSNATDSPAAHSDAAESTTRTATPTSQSPSSDVIDLTSPQSVTSPGGRSARGSLNSSARRARRLQAELQALSDDICGESPNSSIDIEEQRDLGAERHEEEESKEEPNDSLWIRPRDRLVLNRSPPRRRRQLDFRFESGGASSSENRSPQLTPPCPESLRPSLSVQSTRPHRGVNRARERPRLSQPERTTAARVNGYEQEQEHEQEQEQERHPRGRRPFRSAWMVESSPAASAPSPRVSPSPVSHPSPATGPIAQADDDQASIALAQYLQQQENIAAYEEYEARLRQMAQQSTEHSLLPSTSVSEMASLMSHPQDIDPDNMTYEQLLQLGEEGGDVKKERWREMAPFVISRLPTHRWTREHGADTSCIVCQYNLVPNDRAVTLPCTHIFHEDCASGWIQENNSCPLCKREVTSE